MSLFKLTLQCLLTPRLYKIYSSGPNENHYRPQKIERWGDNIILTALTFWNISLYASPLICFCAYKRDVLSSENAQCFARIVSVVSLACATTIIMRGLGRATNPKYLQFLRALQAPEAQRVDILRQYDFEFEAFPVTYIATMSFTEEKLNKKLLARSWYKLQPVDILAALAVKVFGLRLIYPGSIGLIHSLVWSELIRGRAELVENHHGKRHKILTPDGNFVDCMFVDNRTKSPNGRTLVICCEGNSGFYENGVMMTPIAGGYSVLGWNHPGFGGSTGMPYPENEQQAVDAVMQLAINGLKFPVERIVLFGWSIGGYTAAWAARHYPNVQCLVLDASFDDLLPLAVSRMPPSWGPLVRSVVLNHVNLNVGELAEDYPGEIRLVRRVNDEIICIRDGDISTNCGNELLIRIMRHRHPELMTEEFESVLKSYLSLHGTPKRDLYQKLATSSDENVKKAILLVKKYLKDYKSSHCTLLPVEYFEVAGAKD